MRIIKNLRSVGTRFSRLFQRNNWYFFWKNSMYEISVEYYNNYFKKEINDSFY